uniref:Cycloidea-like protein n=1 Tax=Inula linariifolia TaxID=1586302 RepID=A0A346D3Q6_9ASTR|nr:cycloidea-like protein [Inula linariifolia]
MFSSSTPNFPELPSSPAANVFLPPSFFFDYEKDVHDGVNCFNYQNSSFPFISDNYNLFHSPSPSLVMENFTTTMKQDFVSQQAEQCLISEAAGPWCDDLLDSVISCSNKSSSKKKTGGGVSKKDGHTKIFTAQGPRDRRVRLSIDISRKFFCLQDLLGFDKASKTLDWLFSKSMTAIKELIEEKNCCSSSNVTDQSKASFLEAIKEGVLQDEEDNKGKKKSLVDGKRKKNMTQKYSRGGGGFQEINFARDQSRAMARARARERTREKKKQLDDELKLAVIVPDDFESCQNMESNGGENHKAILTTSSLLIGDRWAVVNGGSGVML